jgi:hypothetical protein
MRCESDWRNIMEEVLNLLDVTGCLCSTLTVWKEDKSGAWGCVQAKASYRSMGTTGDPVPVGQRDVPVNHFTG